MYKSHFVMRYCHCILLVNVTKSLRCWSDSLPFYTEARSMVLQLSPPIQGTTNTTTDNTLWGPSSRCNTNGTRSLDIPNPEILFNCKLGELLFLQWIKNWEMDAPKEAATRLKTLRVKSIRGKFERRAATNYKNKIKFWHSRKHWI